MRLVMDADTIVAAMRSPGGASAALLKLARLGRVTLPATAPLCIGYEDVCSRPEHMAAVGFGATDLAVFLDAVIDLVKPIDVWFLWRPQLRDSGDKLVLEAAVNGRATAIATFNRRHFHLAKERFGIDILLPSEAIRRAT
jgi:predicted nucleic acid-binding protein